MICFLDMFGMLKSLVFTELNFEIFAVFIFCIFHYKYKTTRCTPIEKRHAADIVFLFVLFICLFIPLSNIDKGEVSLEENRSLVQLKPFISKDGFNSNFGKNLNAWFNDRFANRMLMINIYYALVDLTSYRIYHQGNVYYDKQTHWAFDEGFSTHLNYENDFLSLEKNIEKLNDFCIKNNIKLYIFVTPNKAEVYSDEAEKCLSKRIINNGDNFVKNLTPRAKNYIISPLNELKKQKERYTFTKGDEHWSEYGGFVSYGVLMNKISKDFKDIKILNENDFDTILSKYSKTDYNNFPSRGGLYEQLNIPDKFLDVSYLHFVYKNSKNIIRIPTKYYPEEITFSDASNKRTIYIIGNSFEEGICDFLIPTFHKVIKKRYNTIPPEILSVERYREDILKEKPDILLIVVTSQGIRDLKNLFKKY